MKYWRTFRNSLSKALSYYEQALKIYREIEYCKKCEGDTLGNIGNFYWDLGDYSRALSYHKQALEIFKETGNSWETRRAEAFIAHVYLEQGRLPESLAVFKRLNDAIGLGKYYLRAGDYQRAREEFTRAIKVAEERRTAEFLVADYIGLGLSNEGLKNYTRAKEYYQKGIELIEGQRRVLGGTEQERFLEAKVMGFSRLEPYQGMVRVLMKEKGKDYQKKALYYAERAKSRVFIEMLATRGLTGKTKEDKAILEQEKKYQQNLLVLRKRIEKLKELGAKAPKGEAERLEKELAKAQEDYERFIKEVKLKNSELASLISVGPAPVEKIQSWLDPDTTLLEYYTTEDKTYAWLVGRDWIKVYEMDIKEKDLEAKVNQFLLPNMSKRSRKPEPVITVPIGEDYKKETSEEEREKNRQRFYQASQEFHKLLAPLEKEIKSKKLIIVPHGVLHKVPFAALADGEKYLVDKYAISVLPASSVIEYIVKKRKPNQGRLLAFANPVTDAVPLFNAEAEVETIAKGFQKKEVYPREKATEGVAKARSSGFDVIHFACHGEFNDRQPLQSGLLLAKDKDNDGYLQVHETFGLDLKNANLVALSACETALSKIQGGDDLVGLSRGFIYAGTPAILATLWKVDDASTAQLMKYFYENWQKGMSKPEALRQAQIALKNITQYRHPYYWAPFVMIGDWR